MNDKLYIVNRVIRSVVHDPERPTFNYQQETSCFVHESDARQCFNHWDAQKETLWVHVAIAKLIQSSSRY